MDDTAVGWGAVLAVTGGSVVALAAHLVDRWSARRWGEHPDRVWWVALALVGLLTVAWAVWLEVFGIR